MGVLVLWLLNKNKIFGDFFGGVVDDNPPANAGNIGSIPGLEDPAEQLSPCTTATEPVL